MATYVENRAPGCLMLTARCPGCGRPTPLSLASPAHLRCVACGYAGPPPAAIRDELAEAAALLSRIQLESRQLSRAQRRALTSAWAGTFGYVALFVILLLPLAGCLACGVSGATEGEDTDWWMVAACSAPAILISITGLIGLAFIVVKRRRLEDACAAIPPLHPGQAARCHVCGGELAQRHGTDAVVRCDYCGADNLVRSKVLARVARKTSAETGSLADQVRRSATHLGLVTGASVVVVTAAVFTLPVLTTLCLITLRMFTSEEVPADDTIQYVELDVEGHGRCLARAYQDRGPGIQLDLGTLVPVGERTRQVQSLEGHRTWRASDLIGQHMVFKDGEGGTVVEVHSESFDGNNRAGLDVGDRIRTVKVKGLCFDPVPSAVTP